MINPAIAHGWWDGKVRYAVMTGELTIKQYREWSTLIRNRDMTDAEVVAEIAATRRIDHLKVGDVVQCITDSRYDFGGDSIVKITQIDRNYDGGILGITLWGRGKGITSRRPWMSACPFVGGNLNEVNIDAYLTVIKSAS